jgi:hypothetical protein
VNFYIRLMRVRGSKVAADEEKKRWMMVMGRRNEPEGKEESNVLPW